MFLQTSKKTTDIYLSFLENVPTLSFQQGNQDMNNGTLDEDSHVEKMLMNLMFVVKNYIIKVNVILIEKYKSQKKW